MCDGIVHADKNLPLEDAMDLCERDPIWAERGKAIQGYAILEQSACSLLSDLGGMSSEVAATVFFKISSASSRSSILEKLLHAKHGSRFNPFWNSYVKELRTIDNKRNEIVHWLSAASVALNDQDMMIVGVTLIPPSSLHRKEEASPYLTSRDLKAFAEKCDVLARACNMFIHANKPDTDAAEADPWLKIFQQPLVYPLPAGHLLAPS